MGPATYSTSLYSNSALKDGSMEIRGKKKSTGTEIKNNTI